MAKGLYCRIELDRDKGICLTVQDEKGEVCQTVHMDGTSITLEVKGKKNKTLIVQTEEKVHIQCPKFIVEAEEIQCSSQKQTVHKSGEDYTVQSSKNISFSAKGTCSASAQQDVSLSSKQGSLSLSASMGQLKGTAMNTEISSKNQVDLEGAQVSVKGKAMTKMEAPMLTVEAKGMLNLKGNMTSLEGSGLTTVKGGVIQLG